MKTTNTRHMIETLPQMPDQKLVGIIDQRVNAGLTLVAATLGHYGESRLIWAVPEPNPAWVALIDAIPQKPPADIDFTDEFKARCFDRARALLYAPAAIGPVPEPTEMCPVCQNGAVAALMGGQGQSRICPRCAKFWMPG